MDDRYVDFNSTDKTLAILSHVSTFAGFVVPLGNIIAPLAIYLVKKDESPYIKHHASEALNFQITLTILMIVSAILILVFIGVLFLIALAILDLILTVVATVNASNGIWYRYPMTIRFVS